MSDTTVAPEEQEEKVNSEVVTTASEETEVVDVPIAVGYTVALKADGNFVFEILGEQKGLVELLGIHQYACTQVEKIKSDATMTGDRLSHELGAVTNILNQKLDVLLQNLQTKPPSANDL